MAGSRSILAVAVSATLHLSPDRATIYEDGKEMAKGWWYG